MPKGDIMGIMAERRCALVQVDRIVFLCLLRGEALLAAEAPFCQDDLSGSPLDGAFALEVLPGGLNDDFRWAAIGRDGIVAPTSLPQAGIAAAIAARLYGLAPGTGRLLGSEVASSDIRMFIPPSGEWWSGEWASGSAVEDLVRYQATTVMHGDIVVRDSTTAEPDPVARQGHTLPVQT
jgi:hypothetical protein